MGLQIQVGKRIKELRLAKGLSQEALAYKAGVDRTYMTGIETGKRNVSIQKIEEVVKALEITISDFFSSPLFNN